MYVPSYLWWDMNMQKEHYWSSPYVWHLMLQWLLSGIPSLCLWRCDDRRIGSICSHCLEFPAGFLCREILRRYLSSSPPFPPSPEWERPQGQAWGEHTAGVSFAPAGFCPTPAFSECRQKHEHSPYNSSTKALWGFGNSPCVVGISCWFFIISSRLFHSRPAQNFVMRFTKASMSKGPITIFALCGEESKKSSLSVEMNDQKLWLAFIVFPFLLLVA